MDYEKIVVSAPTYVRFGSAAKYAAGGPVLIAAINKRIVVSVSASRKSGVVPDRYTSHVQAILTFLKPRLPQETALTLTVSGTYRRELGSYTAFVVVTIGAVTYFSRKLWNPHEINNLAFEYLKRKNLVNGGEVTAASFGGFIWERRELSYLNSLWQLPIKVQPEIDHFYLVRSKSPSSLSFPPRINVRGKLQRETKKIPDRVEDDKRSNEGAVTQLAEALKKGDGKWLRERFQAVAIGDNSFICYDPDTSKYPDMEFEKIHLGEEGVRLEKKFNQQ